MTSVEENILKAGTWPRNGQGPSDLPAAVLTWDFPEELQISEHECRGRSREDAPLTPLLLFYARGWVFLCLTLAAARP